MPAPNLVVAWISIGLQMLAVVRLAKRSYHFPAMMAFAFASLFVVLFALERWDLAWSIGSWTMLLFKFAVVAEACGYVLASLDYPRHAIKSTILLAACGGLAAAALNSQPTALGTSKFICHTAFAAAAFSVLPFARFITQQHRFNIVLVGLYLTGMALADFNGPRAFSPAYWTTHMILAVMQAACWFGWLVLFNDLRHPANDLAYHPSARVDA